MLTSKIYSGAYAGGISPDNSLIVTIEEIRVLQFPPPIVEKLLQSLVAHILSLLGSTAYSLSPPYLGMDAVDVRIEIPADHDAFLIPAPAQSVDLFHKQSL